MAHIAVLKKTLQSLNFDKFIFPLIELFPMAPELKSRGDRPLKMTFEEQLKALVYFHLQEHKSARHLIQDLKENVFAKEHIAPDGGISRSSFSEAINHRGLEQLQFLFENLYKKALGVLPKAKKDRNWIEKVLINATYYLTDSANSTHSALSPTKLNKRLGFQSQYIVVGSNHAILFLFDGILDNSMVSRISDNDT